MLTCMSMSLSRFQVPAPSALEKLDRFVRLNQIRLYDIFVETDKNKDWKMTKEELMKIMQEVGQAFHYGILALVLFLWCQLLEQKFWSQKLKPVKKHIYISTCENKFVLFLHLYSR